MAEKKVNRMKKPASLGDMPAKKQQDQPLRGADTAMTIGKIADPMPANKPKTARRNKAAANTTKKTEEKAVLNMQEPAAENAPVPAKKAKGRGKQTQNTKAENPQAAEKVQAAEKPQTQKTRTRKGQKTKVEKPKMSVRAYFLGGLNEIGKNSA